MLTMRATTLVLETEQGCQRLLVNFRGHMDGLHQAFQEDFAIICFANKRFRIHDGSRMEP